MYFDQFRINEDDFEKENDKKDGGREVRRKRRKRRRRRRAKKEKRLESVNGHSILR